MAEHFALNLLPFPVPNCDEARISSKGQGFLINFFKSEVRVLPIILDYFLLELMVLVNVPNPDGRVMPRAGNLLAITQENNLRYLFGMPSVSMHKCQFLSIPNSNNLLLFTRHNNEIVPTSDNVVWLSTKRIDLGFEFYFYWFISIFIFDQLIDKDFGLVGADIKGVFIDFKGADGLFKGEGLGGSLLYGVFSMVVLGE